jgi:U6 snRNA-associated Sm-like protein LSm6
MRVEASFRDCNFMGLVTLHVQCHCSQERSFHCRIESIIYPAIRKTPSRIRVAKSRAIAFHSSKSCPEVESRAEAGRQTPATSLDHQITRTPNTYKTTKQNKSNPERTQSAADSKHPNKKEASSKMSAPAPNGATTTAAAPAANDARDPSGFLSEIIGAPVTVKLNSGVVYKGESHRAYSGERTKENTSTDSLTLHLFRRTGELQSVDGYMNIALEGTREFVDGKLRRSYGDAFVRGNNGMSIPFSVLMHRSFVFLTRCSFLEDCRPTLFSLDFS